MKHLRFYLALLQHEHSFFHHKTPFQIYFDYFLCSNFDVDYGYYKEYMHEMQ